MKIAIVTDAWLPQINGVVTTLSTTAKMLEEDGHTVLVINPQSFRTIACPTYPEICLSLWPQAKLKSVLKNFEPDAIHIATEGPLGWAARSYCLRNKLLFTTSYHTRFPEYLRMRFPVPLRLSYFIVRHFHSAASRTMVAVPELKDELESYGFKNLVYWSRGVDADLFTPQPKGFLKSEGPISMYVGRVAVEKNIESFLSLDIPGTKYVIGDGPALSMLKEKYPDVKFLGYKRGADLARHVAAADVFVFPSKTDTFGIVLIEAMACGVPVAAYPVTGPSNIIENGVTGILDTNLKTAVLKALELNPEDCFKAARSYSWEKCTGQFFSNLAAPAAILTRPSVFPRLNPVANKSAEVFQ